MSSTNTLALSPCPNDTFMFYHILFQSDWRTVLEPSFLDIEELNQAVLARTVDFAKCSFNTAAQILDDYVLLRAGAALGRGCGPLIVAGKEMDLTDLKGKKLLIPGKNTTAFALAQFFLPEGVIYEEALFSEIMDKVANGDADAGLIIHESRFTYADFGLKLLADVGDLWEGETGRQIPLGAIVAKRSLGEEKIRQFEADLAHSVAQAQNMDWRENIEFAKFIHQYAQEIQADVLDAHIRTYVNEESQSLTEEGKASVLFFIDAQRKRLGLEILDENEVFLP